MAKNAMVEAIIDRVETAGAKMFLRDKRLVVRSIASTKPKNLTTVGSISQDLDAEIREHKDEIIRYLSGAVEPELDPEEKSMPEYTQEKLNEIASAAGPRHWKPGNPEPASNEELTNCIARPAGDNVFEIISTWTIHHTGPHPGPDFTREVRYFHRPGWKIKPDPKERIERRMTKFYRHIADTMPGGCVLSCTGDDGVLVAYEARLHQAYLAGDLDGATEVMIKMEKHCKQKFKPAVEMEH